MPEENFQTLIPKLETENLNEHDQDITEINSYLRSVASSLRSSTENSIEPSSYYFIESYSKPQMDPSMFRLSCLEPSKEQVEVFSPMCQYDYYKIDSLDASLGSIEPSIGSLIGYSNGNSMEPSIGSYMDRLKKPSVETSADNSMDTSLDTSLKSIEPSIQTFIGISTDNSIDPFIDLYLNF